MYLFTVGQIVCRNCSRNKYALKYLKDRLAKVCDGCYAELKKRGEASSFLDEFDDVTHSCDKRPRFCTPSSASIRELFLSSLAIGCVKGDTNAWSRGIAGCEMAEHLLVSRSLEFFCNHLLQ